jgi:hypothetical protein
MLKCVASNLFYDGASVSPTYRKPFDVLAEWPSNENWLPTLDSQRENAQRILVLYGILSISGMAPRVGYISNPTYAADGGANPQDS